MKILEILEYALENYEGTPYGLYFPNLGDQEIVLDDERIAELLEALGFIENVENATDEEIDDLYNRYDEQIDKQALIEAINAVDIDITMIEE